LSGGGEVASVSPGSYLRAVAFHPDGSVLVVAGEKGVTAWKVPTGEPINTLGQWGTGHQAVAFSADGERLVTAAENTVRLGTLRGDPRVLSGHRSHVQAVAFHPGGKTVASGSKDYTIRFWNAESGMEVESNKGHDGTITSLAYSPGGQLLASGSEDKTIKLW